MTETVPLADHLNGRTDAILAVWRNTVDRVGDVPESEKLSYDEFIDHIPQLLERLGERLRGRPSPVTPEGKKHGQVRWRQGYDIAEIVNEYGHLRTALSRATADFARQYHWDLARFQVAIEAINDVLDEATAESVRQFQEDAAAENQAALKELKARQESIEDAWIVAKVEQSKLRTVLDNLPVAVWVVDAEGTIVDVNEEAMRLQGLSRGEIVGRVNVHRLGPDYHISRPDGTAYPGSSLPVDRALRGEVVAQEEFLWSLRGEPRTISVNAAPLTDSAGKITGAVAAVRDITERVEFEAALERQRQLAEESSRHKSRLVAALSHDARTPLNAVVLAAQLLELHFDGDANAEVQECLRTIRNSVHNVLDLLGDLLNLSKIDAGASPAEVSRFPLGPVLEESLSSIETQARIKGIEVRMEPGDLAGASLETDRSKLKQILCNLFSNALRYTDRGYIRIFGERTADQIRFSVEDSGVGIAPEDQARIFDEFTTLDAPGHAPGEGTGLGLAICRRLAALLKGEITLRSTPGRGSTFTLVLPISVLTLSQPDRAGPVAVESPASGAILVAEDHPESRQTLAKVLRRMGYRVLEADNGREALAMLQVERPLAVLMDVNMPIMDGVDATLAIRADARLADLPVFALTGDVTIENQQRIGEAGVDGYLEKPVTWELLKQALGTLGPKTTKNRA